MAFAFFCGVLSVVVPLLAPRPERGGVPADMLLSLSPRFETEGLPAPNITLPNGDVVPPGQRLRAEGGQVLVSVDDELKSVQTLRQTALTLAETASAAPQQATAAVSQAIRTGDYRVLEQQSRTLSTAARDGIAARSRAIRSTTP
jgi:hypothetical protein